MDTLLDSVSNLDTISPMQLGEYLSNHGISDAAFARSIGVERQAVGRYRSGERFPERPILLRIFEATNGAVTANDFAGIAPPRRRPPRAGAGGMTSVFRTLRIFNRHKQEQRLIDRVPQVTRCGWAASQMSGYDKLRLGALAVGNQCAGQQFNLNGTLHNAEGRGRIEIDEGRSGIAVKNDALFGGLCGVVRHDGTPEFFKWDNAKGCMVPFVVSIPFLGRFRRSLEAFRTAWRPK